MEYLDEVCRKKAATIFRSGLYLYGYPHTLEGLNRLRDYCYAKLQTLNQEEKPLVEEYLKDLLNIYLALLLDYNFVYQ